jgi:hypothetical protein
MYNDGARWLKKPPKIGMYKTDGAKIIMITSIMRYELTSHLEVLVRLSGYKYKYIPWWRGYSRWLFHVISKFFWTRHSCLFMITVYVCKSEGFTKIATITVSSWDSSNWHEDSIQSVYLSGEQKLWNVAEWTLSPSPLPSLLYSQSLPFNCLHSYVHNHVHLCDEGQARKKLMDGQGVSVVFNPDVCMYWWWWLT